jgi:peptidoglycan/xylan/chitin deacetylase (PgdA/CDA1 family)
VKRAIKRALGQGLFATQLDALLFKQRAVVVAFHRVQDLETSDGLTVSTQMFERFCRFFRRYFRVVSLREVVDKLERGTPFDRDLAITFDDGYLDNFENAAPVLERLSLPATFFVVSDWIGTGVVPAWDRQQGLELPWMNWKHVRSLHERGFEIGAHTRTHVDLGEVSGAAACEEIFGARCELEARLDAPVELFAYPYGRPENIAPSNRDLIRGAGFRCCCSCFGGVIGPADDPFHLRRIPISAWYSSPHQFGLEAALGMSVLS